MMEILSSVRCIMKEKRWYLFLRNSLWMIALVCIALVAILNIAVTAEVAYRGSERVSIINSMGTNLWYVFQLGVLTLICTLFCERIHCMDEKRLFRFLSLIYTVMALYLILNVDTVLRADSQMIFLRSIEFKNGNYEFLQKGQYIYRYSHQLNLMLFMQWIIEFSENPAIFFVVNFLMVLGINRTWWKISQELFHDKLINIMTLLLCFSFLPQFFYILFIYGLIPGFFFLTVSFYYSIRFLRTKAWRELAVMTVCTGMAVLMKPNYLIGAIAQVIFLFLGFLKDKHIRYLISIVILLFCVTVPGKLIQKGYEQKTGILLEDPCPSVLWVVMGTDIDNRGRGPGWYNSSSWNTYNQAKYDSEKAAELGKENLKKNWEKIKSEPGRAARFFLDKTCSQWCDPMYQSVWSGPLESSGQYTHTPLLQSIYNGEQWEDTIAGIAKRICLVIWILGTAFLAIFGKQEKGWELCFLYFVGGFLFHMIWEGKSQYTYTYIFCLIPFAAYVGSKLIRNIKQPEEK